MASIQNDKFTAHNSKLIYSSFFSQRNSFKSFKKTHKLHISPLKHIICMIFCGKPQQTTNAVCQAHIVKNRDYSFISVSVSFLNVSVGVTAADCFKSVSLCLSVSAVKVCVVSVDRVT